MAITIDVNEGTPVRWVEDGDGATPHPDPDYEPSLYAAARHDQTQYLDWLADTLTRDPKVTRVETERHFRSLGAEGRSPMLRIDLERIDEVRQVAREIRQREHDTHAPGTISLFDVDLDPGFRYCLDTGCAPLPDRDMRPLSLSLPAGARAAGDLSELALEGEKIGGGVEAVLERVETVLAEHDPDVLVLSTAALVPMLDEAGVNLGRRAGYRQLAGESTYVSYGQVGHSPARYTVPGRAIVDRSNSFLLEHSSMAGLLYFVERAGKPLQEIAKDSIGGVLTAMEIREARDRDVLAPWQKRQTERWKSLETLHSADRGGFSFQPEAAVYEDVHELDFASLYPNIIREYDVSPETVCPDGDGERVPELGYSVCTDGGSFLGDVLGPLLDNRATWKRRRREDDGATPDLDAKIEAVKWVLVSCFGYQGYRHAKFGRIEVHEAINAYAREIMLTAKERVEAAGWRIVHGIVDSVWVTPDPDREQRPIREVAAEISDEVEIDLEYEGRFEWIAFCPRKRSSGSALMRYFGRWSDEETDAEDDDRYKLRGIEARQRSSSPFVERAQRDLITVLDRERTPEAVCDRLARHLATLRRGSVPTKELFITQRVSKAAEAYDRASRAKAALERASEIGVNRGPGQSVAYVVVADDRSGPDRVRLALEAPTAYDTGFYADRLVRAAESVLAPLGWDRNDIRQFLAGRQDATLSAFGN